MDNTDLSHLSRTCKTWHAELIPSLYKTLALHIPENKSQLGFFENLVELCPEGLKYTKCLSIVPCHNRYPSETVDGSVRMPASTEQRDYRKRFEPVVLGIFDTLLRLLLKKLPTNALRQFW